MVTAVVNQMNLNFPVDALLGIIVINCNSGSHNRLYTA